MDMTYQLMEQVTAASTTGQTGAKRNAGTQNESDGGFDTMVRQKRQEAAGTAGEADEAQEAVTAAPAQDTDEDHLAMAAALLLQPQPEIVYVEDAAPAAEETLPQTEAVSALPPEQAPEMAETGELPVRTLPERPAEAVAAQRAEKPAAEPVQAQPAAAAPEQSDAQLPKVELNSQSESAELPPDAGRGETAEKIDNKIENIEIETPVFGQVDAAPVKVGAPEALREPVELEAPDGAEQLGEKITLVSYITQSGVSRAELTLSPESLGKLTVEITHSTDGSMHILLSASTEKAAALLEKNLSSLQNVLAASGKTQTTIEVRSSENTQQQFLNPDDQSNRQNQQQQQQQQQRKPRQDALRIADFMNQLRLGLVDLSAAV